MATKRDRMYERIECHGRNLLPGDNRGSCSSNRNRLCRVSWVAARPAGRLDVADCGGCSLAPLG